MSHHLKNRRLKKPAAAHNDRHGADRHMAMNTNRSNEFPRFIILAEMKYIEKLQ